MTALKALADVVLTFVWRDGAGAMQARCGSCSWRGPWRERGSQAVRQAKAAGDCSDHGATHIADPVATITAVQ